MSQEYDESYSQAGENEERSSVVDATDTKGMTIPKKLIGRSYIIGTDGEYERIIRKRKRKSGDQLKILMREFDRNPNWSKETLLEVSRKTGLSEA